MFESSDGAPAGIGFADDLYDLIVYKYPEETDKKIIDTQKRKLKWVKRESDKILCISKSTAEDAQKILGIDKNKLEVVYPGIDEYKILGSKYNL